MIKREELTNPTSCMSRAKDDEMTFVLLGRDAAAPAAIRAWIEKRIILGKNKPEDPQIHEAAACAATIEQQHIVLLKWGQFVSHQEAWLGHKTDGVRFTLACHPTCYRRGQYRLLIEVCGGARHHDWGCFDDADQPERNYHSKEVAMAEAEAIAKVLLRDRLDHGPLDPV